MRPVPESTLKYPAKFAYSGFRILERPEMVPDVGLRSEQALLFAAPEGDADRPSRLDANGLEDARGFHHDGAADGVVGRAGGRMPRVEVAAEHHDFLRPVRAWNLGDHVVARSSFGMGAVDDIELELDGAASASSRAIRP